MKKYFYLSKGLLGTYEAVHFAKPIIGIPIFFDQNKNMKMVEHLGYGIQVPYEDLTTQKLRDAIREIFTDSRFGVTFNFNKFQHLKLIFLTICSYLEKMSLISHRYWNQLKPPLDTAIYWVKYVAKYKGAPHMRSIAIDMPFYVYYNLDCWAFLIGFCMLIVYICVKTCRRFCRLSKKHFTKKIKTS